MNVRVFNIRMCVLFSSFVQRVIFWQWILCTRAFYVLLKASRGFIFIFIFFFFDGGDVRESFS